MEVRCAVVEDEVHACQLLESLKCAASQQTLANWLLKTSDITCGADKHFVLVICLDLSELLDKCGMVDIEASESGERPSRLLVLAALYEETRRLGQDEHADDEDDGPCELYRDWDTVGAGVVAVLSGVEDDCGDEQAYGYGPLVTANDGSAYPLGCSLRLIEWDCRG